jgi:cobaltochelatase CobS
MEIYMTTITQSFGYADDIFGFARFPDAVREASRFPIKQGISQFVPDIDASYVFRKEHLRTIQFWATGVEKNILLQGETGTGKTSLIEQVAARLNWPTFTVGCHGGLEFQELIGRVTLQADGSTGWADGPLIAAMRAGGIFLLDEMNFLKPEVAGGLNTVLQATAYSIPETGELVKAHPDFRIAATGNAMDGVGKGAYRGTQTTNIALLARFTLGIRVKYMSVADEELMISAKAPGIASKVANYLAEVADMARKSHADGLLKAPMSPRETIASGRRLTAYSGNMIGDDALQAQCKSVAQAFEMSFLFRWSSDERSEFVKAANSVASRLGLPIILE